MKETDIEPTQRIIEIGSNMAGCAAGGALGFLFADAQGAVAGAAIGGASGALVGGMLKIIGDVAHRNLSNREEIRIGTVTVFAIEKIRKKIEEGRMLPREDDFFNEREHYCRSNAEEIFEGVLLKSKNEHEEKKIRIIANIFSSTVFHTEISPSEANHILQVAENLTYRQMCLLSLFKRKQEFEEIRLATKDFSQDTGEDDAPVVSELSALQEIYQLHNLGVVAYLETGSENVDGWVEGQIMINKTYTALLSYEDVSPAKMVLTELGERYYFIMDLAEIPVEDIREVAITLSK